MLIKLKYAELHNALFMGGVNLTSRLDASKRPLGLVYDRAEKELWVEHAGCLAAIPVANVAAMVPIDYNDPKLKGALLEAVQYPKKQPPAPDKPIKAQVQVPPGHRVEDYK